MCSVHCVIGREPLCGREGEAMRRDQCHEPANLLQCWRETCSRVVAQDAAANSFQVPRRLVECSDAGNDDVVVVVVRISSAEHTFDAKDKALLSFRYSSLYYARPRVWLLQTGRTTKPQRSWLARAECSGRHRSQQRPPRMAASPVLKRSKREEETFGAVIVPECGE